MIIELPWPPTVNTYWRHLVVGRRAQFFISAKGKAYRKAVAAICAATKGSFDGRLSVTIDAFPPDRRVRDLDNLPKSILDSLTHAGIWNDDNQIDRLIIARKAVEKPGRVIITIEVAEGAA